MGVTIHYRLFCRDKKCAEKIVSETAKVSKNLKKKFPSVEINHISKTEIVVCPNEGSECIHYNFEPYEKKLERHLKKGWDYEGLTLSKRVWVDPAGRRYREWPKGLYGVPLKEEIVAPKFGKDGFQTSGFTKTQYGGVEAHILACRILEPAKKFAHKREISDEGDYCGDGDKEDFGKLTDAFEENLMMVQSIFGQLKSLGYDESRMGGAGFKRIKEIEAAGGK